MDRAECPDWRSPSVATACFPPASPIASSQAMLQLAQEVTLLRRSLLTLLISTLVLACNDATGPSPVPSPGPSPVVVVGTWRLQSVDGRPLPFTLPEEESGGADKLEITAEVITTLNSGSFTMLTTFRVTYGSDVFPESIPGEGTYAVIGSTASFTSSDGWIASATVSSNVMTLVEIIDGPISYTFVYLRD